MFSKKLLTKKNLNSLLRFLELVFLIVVGFFAFRIIYLNTCNTLSCVTSRPSQEDLNLAIQLAFPIFGLLNSFRISTSFSLNDLDPEPEDFFHLSLVGVGISYFISGIFFRDFNQISNREIAQSTPFSLNLLILGFAGFLLFQEKKLWSKSTNFVKVRIALSLIHLVLIAINPYIGFFTALIFFSVMILWKEKLPKSV